MVCPHGLVSDSAVFVDDVNHIGHRAVRTVRGAFDVVHQHQRLNPILHSTIACEFDFLLPVLMLTIMFPWVRLAHVEREKLEPLISIPSIQLVEGRDLAHKRRSGDAAELKQYVLAAAKI